MTDRTRTSTCGPGLTAGGAPRVSHGCVGRQISTRGPETVHGSDTGGTYRTWQTSSDPTQCDQTKYSRPASSNTVPSIAQRPAGSATLPLRVNTPSNGSAAGFSWAYRRWLTLLPSSAAT